MQKVLLRCQVVELYLQKGAIRQPYVPTHSVTQVPLR